MNKKHEKFGEVKRSGRDRHDGLERKKFRKPEDKDRKRRDDRPERQEKHGRPDSAAAPDRPGKPERKERFDRPGQNSRRNRSETRESRPGGDWQKRKPRVNPKNEERMRTAEPGESLPVNNDDERLILKGRHEVVQALESKQQLDSIVISTALRGPVGGQVRELASKAQIPVKEMNPDLFARKFGDKSQGIVAIGGTFAYCSLEEIVEKASAGRGVLIALNHVEDARNLGAVVRTVEASGCSGVIIPKHRSASMTEWAVRTAQGAASVLPVARVNNLGDALEVLKEVGYWVVGLDGDAPKRYDEVVYSGKIVLVAGGEDAGLGERVRNVCDDVVSIPLLGKTPSLNVSVSTAVALYEILRQKQFFKK